MLASLRAPKTIAQRCREHHISESLLRKWREQSLAAGANTPCCTVKKHVANVLPKLDIRSRAQAVRGGGWMTRPEGAVR